MVFNPSKRIGLISGAVIGLTIGAIIVVLVGALRRQGLGAGSFVTAAAVLVGIVFSVMWAVRYAELASLRYIVDRNALTIRAGLEQIEIPLSAIERISVGADEQESAQPRGINWPGFLRRRSFVNGRRLYVLSTEPPERQLVVTTASAWYRISPGNAEAFIDALQSRRGLGAVREVTEGVRRLSIAAWPIWQDRLFWGLVLGAAVANVALWAAVAFRYEALPERMPLHYDASGQVDRVASKVWVMGVPGIGTLATVVNVLFGITIRRREREAGMILQAVSLALHLVLGLAAAGILWG